MILSNVVFVSESFKESEKNALSAFLITLLVIALLCSFASIVSEKTKKKVERNDMNLFNQTVMPEVTTLETIKLENKEAKFAF
jgi:hypothetical protein